MPHVLFVSSLFTFSIVFPTNIEPLLQRLRTDDDHQRSHQHVRDCCTGLRFLPEDRMGVWPTGISRADVPQRACQRHVKLSLVSEVLTLVPKVLCRSVFSAHLAIVCERAYVGMIMASMRRKEILT